MKNISSTKRTTITPNPNPTFVIPVIMLDPPLHTKENGYRCSDPTCPCQKGKKK